MSDESQVNETELETAVDENPALEALVLSALNKQPTEFMRAFGDIMTQKLQERVAARKAEIGATMFNPVPEVAEVAEVAEVEDEEDEETVDEAKTPQVPALPGMTPLGFKSKLKKADLDDYRKGGKKPVTLAKSAKEEIENEDDEVVDEGEKEKKAIRKADLDDYRKGSKKPVTLAKSAKEEDEADEDEEILDEKYLGFKKLEGKLKGKVSNPGAVAASIGMKKYGKDKFEKAAHEGKKLKGK